MIYSTQGRVFTIERWSSNVRSQAWTAVEGYAGLYRNDMTKRPVVAYADTEYKIKQACRWEAERMNRRAERETVTPPC